MKKIILILACTAIVAAAPCQSKKERKKNKIKSTTEFVTTAENGKTGTYKSQYEEFDKEGHSILMIEYSETGAVLHKETAKYDSYKNKTEETSFDAAKKKNTRKTYKYNALQDMTEEVEYNPAGAVIKKTVFAYAADGNKSSETVYDGSGTLLKKIIYSYNSKDLKSERKTFNSANILETVKKWEYEYY
jgi:hypothetical protein